MVVRIALDVSPALATRPAGVGRYVRELATALGGVEALELVPARHTGRLLRRWSGRYGRVYVRPGCFARLNGLLLSGTDLVHWTKNQVSAATTQACVVTVHDCFDLYFGLDDVRRGGWADRVAAKYRALRERPRRIIADSRHTAGMLAERGGVDPERIRVVPLGVAAAFRRVRPEDGAAVAQAHGLSRPYFLFVGSLCLRKNLDGLLAAWRAWRARSDAGRNHDLVLCGGIYHDAEREVRAALAEPTLGVRRVDAPGVSELAALYAGARALVWPSRAEGFGLPVLEAMSAGTPVLTSTATSMPELAGDAALLVDPEDLDALVGGMERLATEPVLRDDLIRRGRARAEPYTWERTASATAEVYREALEVH